MLKKFLVYILYLVFIIMIRRWWFFKFSMYFDICVSWGCFGGCGGVVCVYVLINFLFDIVILIMVVVFIVKLGGIIIVLSRGRFGRFWWKSWVVVVVSKYFFRVFWCFWYFSFVLDWWYFFSCLKFICCYLS